MRSVILDAVTSWPKFLAKWAFARKPVRFEAEGSGPVLFLGFPITMGPSGDPSLLRRYVERLRDDYRVIVMDYPPTGRDAKRARQSVHSQTCLRRHSGRGECRGRRLLCMVRVLVGWFGGPSARSQNGSIERSGLWRLSSPWRTLCGSPFRVGSGGSAHGGGRRSANGHLLPRPRRLAR